MSQIFFSSEITRYRSLLIGGVNYQEIQSALQLWKKKSERSKKKFEFLRAWFEAVELAINEAAKLGSSLSPLFKNIQPLIRSEELFFRKRLGIEKQFAFQAALAVVIPWAAIGISEGIVMNFLSIAGLIMQCFGVGFFYFLFWSTFKEKKGEQTVLREFLVRVYLLTSVGESLRSAIEKSNRFILNREIQEYWQRWIDALGAGSTSLGEFKWPKNFVLSKELSDVFKSFIQSGAPSSEILLDRLQILIEERQFDLEEKIQNLPTKLSLTFCLFFTPAIFFILLGALWPSLQLL